MGILAEPAQFVRELHLPRGFSVCELGDQYLTETRPHMLAKDWFEKELGCGRYESIDGNGRGTLLHDLNKPVAIGLWEAFDLVTDFGTGEHVFNQQQVWKTVHSLCKVGGHIAFDRPIQGYPGHCFYLIDPSLVTDIAAANKYDIIKLERRKTSRGELVRGVFRKTNGKKLRVPQQGRYAKILQLEEAR